MNRDKKSNLSNASRRKFTQGFAALVGGATAERLLTGNVISVAAAYSRSSESATSKGKVFSQHQLALLKSICSIVIPETDTLGAAEIDTHGFIDNLLFHCFDQSRQQSTVKLLDLVDASAERVLSHAFLDLPADKKFTLLTDLDLGQRTFDKTQRDDFKSLKELICFGYYTSEVGATKELRYQAVPGVFKGSIPYKKSDPTWATEGLFS